MFKVFAHKFAVVLVVLLAAQFSHAQRWLTNDGMSPVNPNSGLEVDPVFTYDPADGTLFLFNAGPNGVDDTVDDVISGDDFGFLDFTLTVDSLTTIEQLLPPFSGGVAFGAPVFFNGTLQMVGTSATGAGHVISEDQIPLVRLDTGLTVDDFRDADGNVRITTTGLSNVGDAFATGAFQIVPEPSSFGLLLTAGLVLLFRIRR